jgi:hypothetical protein
MFKSRVRLFLVLASAAVVAVTGALALSGTAQAITRVSGNADGAVAFIAPGDTTFGQLGYYMCNAGPLAMSTTSFLRVFPSPPYANRVQDIAVVPYFQYYSSNGRWVNWGYGRGQMGPVGVGGSERFNFSGAWAFSLQRGYNWRVLYDIRWLVNGTQIGQAWYSSADDIYYTGGIGYNIGWCGLL